MKLTVIMPVYNEEKTLEIIIQKIKNVPINKEIIIVNDGSTDKSGFILNNHVNEENVKIIHHTTNLGKGSSIRSAIEFITGDIVIIQDADLETNPNDYLHLIDPIIKKQTKIVYGSRYLGSKKIYNKKYYYGGRLITFITNLLYNQKITDAPTCYKVFDSELFKSIPLRCKKFEFCPEITAKVSKKGIKIIELPMQYYPRSINEGKKLRWIDGIQAIWILIKYRFVN